MKNAPLGLVSRKWRRIANSVRKHFRVAAGIRYVMVNWQTHKVEGIVHNLQPKTSHRPGVTDNRPQTIFENKNRPPTNKNAKHRPLTILVTNHRPLTRPLTRPPTKILETWRKCRATNNFLIFRTFSLNNFTLNTAVPSRGGTLYPGCVC